MYKSLFPIVINILDTFNGENQIDIQNKITMYLFDNHVSVTSFIYYFLCPQRILYSKIFCCCFYKEKQIETYKYNICSFVGVHTKYNLYVENIRHRQNGYLFSENYITSDERRLIKIVKSIALNSELKDIEYVVCILNVVKHLKCRYKKLSYDCEICGNEADYSPKLENRVDNYSYITSGICKNCYNDVQCLLTK